MHVGCSSSQHFICHPTCCIDILESWLCDAPAFDSNAHSKHANMQRDLLACFLITSAPSSLPCTAHHHTWGSLAYWRRDVPLHKCRILGVHAPKVRQHFSCTSSGASLVSAIPRLRHRLAKLDGFVPIACASARAPIPTSQTTHVALCHACVPSPSHRPPD
jgi:hypothetical protein